MQKYINFKYISNNKTKAKLWLCYEYEKPYLIMVPLSKDKID